MMKDNIRFYDMILSALALVCLSPLMLLAALCIKLTSKGPVFFKQQRVGLHNRDFYLLKFRTMYINTQHHSPLTIGANDSRITKPGSFLRRYKLDELPQLWNVLKGDMSIVGPRPELRRYVNYYTKRQMQVLSVKPGITDNASICFKNENALLETFSEPEKAYIEQIMPDKILLNEEYINNRNTKLYFKTIFATLYEVMKQ